MGIEDKIGTEIISPENRKEAGSYDRALEYLFVRLWDAKEAKEARPYMENINNVLSEMYKNKNISNICANDYTELFYYVIENRNKPD